MDGASFDRIARALGAGMNRRSGIFGALGAIAGFGAGLPDSDGIAAKGKDKDGRGPGVAAPCGKGRKKNLCTKNSDCCTNICKTKIKNKDHKGRCRCERKGRPCSEDRNCCGSITCVAGKCGGKAPMVATGDACGPKDVCRDPNAECTTYQFDTPAGTYCLLPVMGRCSSGSDCVSSRCRDGVCKPCSIVACADACSPTVCATCTHTTVQDAIDAATDGDVIAIGKGTWVEDLKISNKELTLRACPNDRVTLRNATYGNRTITVTGGKSLAVLDLVIDGYASYADSYDGGGIGSDGNLTLAGATIVKNGGWSTQKGGGVKVSGDGLTVTVTDEVVIRDNECYLPGGGLSVDGASDLAISGWAEITGNEGDSYGGGVATGGAGVNVTISGHVRITGNHMDSYAGAGVSIYHAVATRETTLTVKDDVVIADNSATGSGKGYGGGIYMYGNSAGPVTAVITDRVQITGNFATRYGGGIQSDQSVKMTISGEVEISGNTCDSYGGGVMLSWYDVGRAADWVQLTITDTAQVTGNTAVKGGGGIYVYSTDVVLEGSAVISGNIAPKGGGVRLLEGSNYPATMTVSGDATITGNTATDSSPSGGGVNAGDTASTLTAVAGSITGNTPDQCAGGTITC